MYDNPLTLEQLREMDGQPIYVVPKNQINHDSMWCVICISEDGDDNRSTAELPGVDYWNWKFKDYGKTWIAYAYSPTIIDLISRAEAAEARAEKAEECIYAIEDDLDRGNDNDWAREHIAEWRTKKGV